LHHTISRTRAAAAFPSVIGVVSVLDFTGGNGPGARLRRR
jgi:hypothetical protein